MVPVPWMKEKGDFSAALVATEDIPAGDKVTISYVPFSVPNDSRIFELESDKFFRCRCPRYVRITSPPSAARAVKDYVEEAEGFLADIQAIVIEPVKQEVVRMLFEDIQSVR